jgi:hypothetical protein
MMYNKNWYKSKTIWGGIIAVVASIFGVVLPTDLTNGSIDLPNIIAAAGGVLAVYGRARATAAIAPKA